MPSNGHPASLSSACRRRSPARATGQAGAAELASLKQSSRFLRLAGVVLGSAEGSLVCAIVGWGRQSIQEKTSALS